MLRSADEAPTSGVLLLSVRGGLEDGGAFESCCLFAIADFERLKRFILARAKDKEENYKLGEQGRIHTWHILPRGFGHHDAERILYSVSPTRVRFRSRNAEIPARRTPSYPQIILLIWKSELDP